MRRALTLVAVLALALLAGCSSAKPATLLDMKDYARGAYLQGVADGRSSVKCQPTVIGATIMIPPAVASDCDKARQDAASIQEAARAADFAISNNLPPDQRQRALMRYMELGGRVSGY